MILMQTSLSMHKRNRKTENQWKTPCHANKWFSMLRPLLLLLLLARDTRQLLRHSSYLERVTYLISILILYIYYNKVRILWGKNQKSAQFKTKFLYKSMNLKFRFLNIPFSIWFYLSLYSILMSKLRWEINQWIKQSKLHWLMTGNSSTNNRPLLYRYLYTPSEYIRLISMNEYISYVSLIL